MGVLTGRRLLLYQSKSDFGAPESLGKAGTEPRDLLPATSSPARLRRRPEEGRRNHMSASRAVDMSHERVIVASQHKRGIS